MGLVAGKANSRSLHCAHPPIRIRFGLRISVEVRGDHATHTWNLLGAAWQEFRIRMTFIATSGYSGTVEARLSSAVSMQRNAGLKEDHGFLSRGDGKGCPAAGKRNRTALERHRLAGSSKRS